jgi:2-phosphosulfolactate phosphatase
MRITVALTPKLLREPRSHAVGVVDVLRASSSLVAMFERGLLRALVADTLRDARALAIRNFSLLCGEIRSLPIAGFDYGNSPAEFNQLSLKGKSAVLYTTNGTRALSAAADAPFVAVASFVNRAAATRRLIDEAVKRDADVAIVCAGLERGLAFSLEDSVAAGALVDAARAIDPAIALTDSAWAAYHLWRFYRGNPERVFRHAAHARALRELGFDADLAYAAALDTSSVVPVLFDDDGVKTLRMRSRGAGRGTADERS